MNTIAKAKGLLVEPGKTWDGIAAEPMTLGGVFTSYVLPLAAIPSIGSAIGTFLGGNLPNIAELLISYAVAVVSVLIMGKIMPPLAARCGATPDAVAGLMLAAFAPTGAWVGGLALIVPSLGGFLALIGALYTLYLFYDGAQRLFPVAQVKARMLGFSAVLASILLNMLIGLGVGILAN
ncbi:MAG: YIP1 family protein [Alphaproteobacteria bacterium]